MLLIFGGLPTTGKSTISQCIAGSTGAQTSNESNGAAQVQFHGVLALNSRYRESAAPLSAR